VTKPACEACRQATFSPATRKPEHSICTSTAGTLHFAPGEASKTVTIEVKGDNKREANVVFYLDLFGNSGSALFAKNRGIGTILNDD
jgi:hypothetical protein